MNDRTFRPHLYPWSRAAVAAFSTFIFLIGVSVMIGWRIHNEMLITVLPGHVSMKVNTAIGFITAGLGVLSALLPATPGRLLSRIAGVLTLVIGAATLLEYVAHRDIHIDQLFFLDFVQGAYPGRMSYISAIEFCFTGVALLLLRGRHKQRRTAEVIAFAVSTSAFTAIVGSFYGITMLYGALGYTAMALHTGICFLLIGVAMMLASSHSILAGILSSSQRGGWLARRLLLTILIGPPLLGKIYLLPAVNLGTTALSMAMFAVTIAVVGVGTLLLVAVSLNRSERRLVELDRLREASAREALHNERELLLITDQLPTLLSYINVNGVFVRVNRTYEKWLGRPASEIVGQSVAQLLGEQYWQNTLSARIAIRSGNSVTFDTIYPTRTGDRHAQVTYAPDFDENGELRGFASLVLDIHDRFQAEHALRQSEKLAAVGRLASSIAHEMNNPLEAVTNLLYLAELDSSKPEEVRHYIEQAQTELTRVTHIVTQTLRFHRQASHPISCHVSAIVSQVIALYQGRLTQKNVTVHERFRDVHPVLCRDGEIRQVIANFVGNAADAMGTAGSLLLRTRNTRMATNDTGVVITIADTGCGIDPAIRERLFEPFQTTKGATGSGLGLWISREIVERHHGRIRVRSSQRPGACGTVFQIFLGSEQVTTQASTASR